MKNKNHSKIKYSTIDSETESHLMDRRTFLIQTGATATAAFVGSVPAIVKAEALTLSLSGTGAGFNIADSNFSSVSLLLNGNGGSNGQQNNTFLDSSGNNYGMTRVGEVTQGSFGPFGNSWSNHFDGSGDYFSMPSTSGFDFSAGTFTLEFWVFLLSRSSESVRVLMFGTNNTTTSFSLAITSTGTVEVGRPLMGSTGVATTSSVSLNSWTHIAFVHNGSTGALYLNGIKSSADVSVTLPTAGSLSLTVGFDTTTPSGFGVTGYLNGFLSNLHVLKSTAKYTSNFIPSSSPLNAVSGTSLLTCQSNRFVDNSTNNAAITVYGDTKVLKESPFPEMYNKNIQGASAYFDGSGDYLTLPANTWNFGSGNFTVEAWVYLQTTSASVQIIGAHNYGTDCSWGFFVCSTNLSFGWNTSLSAAANCTIPLNSWHHVVLVRDANTVRFFLNGVQVGTGTISVGINSDSRLISIGSDFDGNGSVLAGYISNLRVVKGTALYTSNFSVPTTPLSAVSNTAFLLKCDNAGVVDLSGKHNFITNGNAQISTSVYKYGASAMSFDGAGDSFRISNSMLCSFTGDFTIECWFYCTGFRTAQNWYYNYIFCSDNNGNWSSPYINAAIIYNGTLSVGYVAGSNGAMASSFATANAVSLNTWHHMALVRNGSNISCYFDGVSLGTSNNGNAISCTGLIIGDSRWNFGSESWQGYLDEFRITKGVARYTSNFTPPIESFPVR